MSEKIQLASSISEVIVDATKLPHVPHKQKLDKHMCNLKMVRLDGAQIELCRSTKQINAKEVPASDVYEEYSTTSGILNATVLDVILRHPQLVDGIDFLKNNLMIFIGSVFITSDGYRVVRCLQYESSIRSGKWGWGQLYLDSYFESAHYIARLLRQGP